MSPSVARSALLPLTILIAEVAGRLQVRSPVQMRGPRVWNYAKAGTRRAPGL